VTGPRTHHPSHNNHSAQLNHNRPPNLLTDVPTRIRLPLILGLAAEGEPFLLGKTERVGEPPAVEEIVHWSPDDFEGFDGDDEVDDVVVGSTGAVLLRGSQRDSALIDTGTKPAQSESGVAGWWGGWMCVCFRTCCRLSGLWTHDGARSHLKNRGVDVLLQRVNGHSCSLSYRETPRSTHKRLPHAESRAEQRIISNQHRDRGNEREGITRERETRDQDRRQRMDLGQADKHEYDDVQRRSGRNEYHAPSESVEEQPDHRGEDDWDHALEGRVVPRRELRGAARGGLDVGEVRGVDGHCGVLEDFWEAWGIRAL
jgi:hypothetical protein